MKSGILLVALTVAIVAAVFSACDDHTCLRESDCSQSQACVMGSCTTVVGGEDAATTDAGSVLFDANSPSPVSTDDDADIADSEAGASEDDADAGDASDAQTDGAALDASGTDGSDGA